MNGPGSLFASESFLGISSQPRNDFGNFFGSSITKPSSSVTPRHPLEGTHELRQACQICFVKSGWNKQALAEGSTSSELVTTCEHCHCGGFSVPSWNSDIEAALFWSPIG
jgi:hypothetical protein